MPMDFSTLGLPVIPNLLPDDDPAHYCPGCHKYRSKSHFPNGRKTCGHCKKLRDRSHQRYIDERRVEDVARRYGLTPDDLLAMRESHNNKCAICGLEETHSKKNGQVMALSVDHDHASGTVRGLLCHRCNLLLGSLERTDPGVVDKAWEYLTKHKSRTASSPYGSL